MFDPSIKLVDNSGIHIGTVTTEDSGQIYKGPLGNQSHTPHLYHLHWVYMRFLKGISQTPLVFIISTGTCTGTVDV